MISILAAAALALALPRVEVLPGGPPRVETLEPTNRAKDVDAKKVTKLVVTFDRSMMTDGWSLCGGGENYPVLKGKPHWDSTKKLVIEVELEPDHEYAIGLNCGDARRFKGADGTALEPVTWTFSTAAEPPADPKKQKSENTAAFDALKKLLAESYSYYDLRSIAWPALYREHEKRILGAKSAKEWTRAVAGMLGVTQDIHMYLKVDGQTHGTGKRAVDPLYREALIPKYLTVKPVGGNARRGRTDDGIGYLMIPEWSDPKQIDAVEEALPAMKDCKALVVDVRPNSGGNELLAQRIAAWFVEGSRVYGKNRYRNGPGKNAFGPVLDRTIVGNSEPEKRLSMPVVVLTSRYVMSSNESFVLMMRQAADCTVVGQKTFGSSGNPKPHELPNGVTIVMPSWQDLRLDGTCFEGEGLAPDVEVKTTPEGLAEKDPILERGLEVLREKIAGGVSGGK